MKNLSQMLKKAQEMQTKMGEMQDQLAEETATGEAGGGLVKVTLNGKGEMTALSIHPSLLEDGPDMLEDLIRAAHKLAKEKTAALMAEKMQELTGGLPLPPDFKLPF